MGKRIISALLVLALALTSAATALADGETAAQPDQEYFQEPVQEPVQETSGGVGPETAASEDQTEPETEPEPETETEPAPEPEPETEPEPEETGPEGWSGEYITIATNPFYEAEPEEGAPVRARAAADDELPPVLDGEGEPVTETEAVVLVRTAMADRGDECIFSLEIENASQLEKAQITEIAVGILYSAWEHIPGVTSPTEGDYIRWHYKQVKYGYRIDGDTLTLQFLFTYYTTHEQEEEVGAVIDGITSGTEGLSDYRKIKKLYDWTCANVAYDFAALARPDSRPYCYSAYGAAILHSCVCQGFASFMYRGLLSMGIDCRLIAGTGGGESHGWDLVRLDGSYYYIDATWDRGKTNYTYFLKGRPFNGHTNRDEFNSAEFYAAYPVSTSDYLTPIVSSYDDIDTLAAVLDTQRDAYMLLVSPKAGLNYGPLMRGHSNLSILGDGMRDGRLNVLDVGFLVGYTLGRIEKNEWYEITCDVNGDGAINVLDIELLARYAAGLVDSYDA